MQMRKYHIALLNSILNLSVTINFTYKMSQGWKNYTYYNLRKMMLISLYFKILYNLNTCP